MRPPTTLRPPPWTALLLLATTASSLTLSSFQLITSSGTPIACLIVYSAPLAGCSTRDFTSGNACSPACVAGIADVQSRIVDVCDGVDASSASVLGQAQRGNLVPLLCPSRGQASPSTRSSGGGAITLTTVPPSSSRSTSTRCSSSSLTMTSSETARSRPPVEDPPPPASDLPPPPPPVAQPTPTFVQSERPVQRPTTSTSGGGRRPEATGDSDSSSGGGSPFDTVSRGGVGRGVEVGGWVVYVAAAVGLLVGR